MSNNNPWQLYQFIPNWEEATQVLNTKLDLVLAKLDRLVASGTPIALAAHTVFIDMDHLVLSRTDLRKYGSDDSEPRSYLASRIQRHIREKHHVNYYVDRFGDVTESRIF